MEKQLFRDAMNLVKIDNVNELMELVKDQDAYSVSLLLCYAAEVNATKTLKWLLESEDIMPDMCDNFALRIASEKGNTNCVELLLADSRVDSSALERVTEKREIKTNTSEKEELTSEENDIDVDEEVEDIESQESENEGDLELPEVEDDLDFLDIPEEEEVENFDEIKEEIEKIETEDLETDYDDEDYEEKIFKEVDKNVKKGWDSYVSVSKDEIDKIHETGKVWVPDFLKKSKENNNEVDS